jgi:hypothetical protein
MILQILHALLLKGNVAKQSNGAGLTLWELLHNCEDYNKNTFLDSKYEKPNSNDRIRDYLRTPTFL